MFDDHLYFGEDPDGVIRIPEWYKENQADRINELMQRLLEETRREKGEALRRAAAGQPEGERVPGVGAQPGYNCEQNNY